MLIVPSRTLLYVGSYTGNTDFGIRGFEVGRNLELVQVSRTRGIDNPSYLAANPSQALIHAVSEVSTGDGDGGEILTFTVDPGDGSLTPISKAKSHGDAPCYISVEADGSQIYVANYVSGTVAAYKLQLDGRFGELVSIGRHQGKGPTNRQEGPHAHCVVPLRHTPGYVAVDLGIDKLISYSPDGHVQSELLMAPGSGPRHLTWHPQDPIGFVVGELDSTITIVGMAQDATLIALGTWPTLPGDFKGNSIGAEVRVHPSGRFVYVSNRGHDSVAVFEFLSDDQTLQLLGHVSSGGRTPRNFAIDPSGETMVVANQDTNSLVMFSIDLETGMPAQTEMEYSVPEPVCVLFVGQTR